MTLAKVLIIGCLAFANPLLAFSNSCETLMDGILTNPLVWTCGCDPASCDTLYVSHALTLDTDLELFSQELVIGSTGSISSSARLVINGSLVNNGSLFAPYLRLWGPGTAQNTGTIGGGVFITVKDSCHNDGRIITTDSIVVGVIRYLVNDGRLQSGVLYNLGRFYNSDTTIVETLNSYSFTFSNTGVILATGSVTSEGTSFYNFGTVEADSISILHGFLCWACRFTCRTAFVNGRDFSVEGEFVNNGSLITRDFYNTENGFLRGPGSICISGYSENHGALQGSLDICDATPTLTEAPFLDVNTGTFWQSVHYCANGYCSTIGLEEQQADEQFEVYPVPMVNDATIDLSGMSEVRLLRLLDPLGKVVWELPGPFGSTIVLRREGLPSGLYFLSALDRTGGVLATRRIVIGP